MAEQVLETYISLTLTDAKNFMVLGEPAVRINLPAVQ
jgi:hypothetical protein